jgi:uncharacterized protein (DUF427 family)
MMNARLIHRVASIVIMATDKASNCSWKGVHHRYYFFTIPNQTTRPTATRMTWHMTEHKAAFIFNLRVFQNTFEPV